MTRMDAGITPEQFELLLPLACQWAAAQEQRICSHGQALSDAQLADARLAGVAEPERVRLLYEKRDGQPFNGNLPKSQFGSAQPEQRANGEADHSPANGSA